MELAAMESHIVRPSNRSLLTGPLSWRNAQNAESEDLGHFVWVSKDAPNAPLLPLPDCQGSSANGGDSHIPERELVSLLPHNKSAGASKPSAGTSTPGTKERARMPLFQQYHSGKPVTQQHTVLEFDTPSSHKSLGPGQAHAEKLKAATPNTDVIDLGSSSGEESMSQSRRHKGTDNLIARKQFQDHIEIGNSEALLANEKGLRPEKRDVSSQAKRGGSKGKSATAAELPPSSAEVNAKPVPSPSMSASMSEEGEEDDLWRQLLNKRLREALMKLKRDLGDWETIFWDQVNEKEAPDYYRFVDEDKEMWLGHVAHKTSLGAYSSVAEFTADVQQIAANCKAYNSASGSKNGNKDMLRAANDLLYALEDILESSQFDKMDEMRSSKSSSQGLLSGEATRQPVFLPLPTGCLRKIVASDKPGGRVSYTMECHHPDCSRPGPYKMDGVGRVAGFVDRHRNCSKEWSELALMEGESHVHHRIRLRKTFPFTKEPPARLNDNADIADKGLHPQLPAASADTGDEQATFLEGRKLKQGSHASFAKKRRKPPAERAECGGGADLQPQKKVSARELEDAPAKATFQPPPESPVSLPKQQNPGQKPSGPARSGWVMSKDVVHCTDNAAANDDDKVHRKEIAAKRRATNLEDVSEDRAFLRERIAILEERLQTEKKYAEHLYERNTTLEAHLAQLNESDES